MARAHGQLDRALTALTVGVATAQRDREQLGEKQGEYVQQARLPVKGTAVAGSVATAVHMVQFVSPFLFAPGQRYAPFVTPHFHFGVVWTKLPYDVPDPIPRDFVPPPEAFLRLHAHVLKWRFSPENWVTAAYVEMGVEAPNASDAVEFTGEVHFTFQGYCSYPEADA